MHTNFFCMFGLLFYITKFTSTAFGRIFAYWPYFYMMLRKILTLFQVKVSHPCQKWTVKRSGLRVSVSSSYLSPRACGSPYTSQSLHCWWHGHWGCGLQERCSPHFLLLLPWSHQSVPPPGKPSVDDSHSGLGWRVEIWWSLRRSDGGEGRGRQGRQDRGNTGRLFLRFLSARGSLSFGWGRWWQRHYEGHWESRSSMLGSPNLMN